MSGALDTKRVGPTCFRGGRHLILASGCQPHLAHMLFLCAPLFPEPLNCTQGPRRENSDP